MVIFVFFVKVTTNIERDRSLDAEAKQYVSLFENVLRKPSTVAAFPDIWSLDIKKVDFFVGLSEIPEDAGLIVLMGRWIREGSPCAADT